AVSELVGGVVQSAGSPVVAVGGYVIDHVPPGAKDLAIEWFGTNDKVALIVGTLIVLALLGIGLGLLAPTRPGLAAGVVLAVATLGVLATLDQTQATLFTAIWPSYVGAGASVLTLVLLGRAAEPTPQPAAPPAATDVTERPRALHDMPARRR